MLVLQMLPITRLAPPSAYMQAAAVSYIHSRCEISLASPVASS